MVQWSLLGILTIIAFVIDIRTSRIPNWLTVSGVVAGICYHLISNGWQGLLVAISGMLLGLFLLYVLYLFRALGAGDVKLFSAYGAIAGMEFVIQNIIYAILYAGLIGIVLLILKKRLIQRLLWILHILFSIVILKEWQAFKQLPKTQMLQFPFMWAVLPAVITYGISVKGMI